MTTLAPSILIGSSLFLLVKRSTIKALDGFEIRQDQTLDFEVICP